MFPSLLPFLLFAFVASITPGPTNILVLSNSARYGLKAALPIILGACGGAAGIVLLVGSGVGQSLAQLPKVQVAMQWIGMAWLTYLSWQIYSAPAGTIAPNAPQKPLGLVSAASLQLVNPKTWMMALAVVSVYAGNGDERQSHVLYLSLAFFVIALPCLGVWALLGVGTNRMFRSPKTMQRFNRCMAVLLLVSSWLSVWV